VVGRALEKMAVRVKLGELGSEQRVWKLSFPLGHREEGSA
jgi:hypothetical protein